jgi:hypothetical protein
MSQDPKLLAKAARTKIGLPKDELDADPPIAAPPSSKSPKGSRRALGGALLSSRKDTKRPGPPDGESPGAPRSARRWPYDDTHDYAASGDTATTDGSIRPMPIVDIAARQVAVHDQLPAVAEEDVVVEDTVEPVTEPVQSRQPATMPSQPPSAPPHIPEADIPEAATPSIPSPIFKLFDSLEPKADEAPKDEETEDKPLVPASLLGLAEEIAKPEEWPGLAGEKDKEKEKDKPKAKPLPAPVVAAAKPVEEERDGISKGWLLGALLAIVAGVGVAYFLTVSGESDKPKPTASSTKAPEPEPVVSATPQPAPAPSPAVEPPPEPSVAPSASASAAPSASASAAPAPRPRGPRGPRPLPDIYEP